jgi:hypothetical protein
MNDGAKVGTGFIYGFVEGELGGWWMESINSPIFSDTDDVLWAEFSFVHSSRSDPDISVVVQYGDVATRGGGHFVMIDSLKDHCNFISGMEVLVSHNIFPINVDDRYC